MIYDISLLKSIALKCFLKVAEQAVFRSDVVSRFQACGPATENALEPDDDETLGISHCPVSAVTI